MINKPRKYVPHLPTMQAVCEYNYLYLIRMIPDCDELDMTYEFAVGDQLQYRIQIVETAKYTTTVSLSQVSKPTPAFLKPQMTVRLYHDARMAEVISSQNTGAFAASYPYPNNKMRQKDEKHRVNVFLAEWLEFCRQFKPVALS